MARYTSEFKRFVEENKDEIFDYNKSDFVELNGMLYFNVELKYVKSVCKGEWSPNITPNGLSNIISDLHSKKVYFAKMYSNELKKINIDDTWEYKKYVLGFVIRVLNSFDKKQLLTFFKKYDLYFLIKVLAEWHINYDLLFKKDNVCGVDSKFMSQLTANDVMKIVLNYISFCANSNVELDSDFMLKLLSSKGLRIGYSFVEKVLPYFKNEHDDEFKKKIMNMIINGLKISDFDKLEQFLLDNLEYADEGVFFLTNYISKFMNEEKAKSIIKQLNKNQMKKIIKTILDNLSLFGNKNLGDAIESFLPDEKIIVEFIEKMLKEKVDDKTIKEIIEVIFKYKKMYAYQKYDIVIILDKYEKCDLVSFVFSEYNLKHWDFADYYPNEMNCFENSVLDLLLDV